MKYALFLLALIVGSVSGIDSLQARVTGSSQLDAAGIAIDDPSTGYGTSCDSCTMDNLYKRCVEDTAIARGAVLEAERRELRGNRLLCPSVCTAQYLYRGHWCWYRGCHRRLTLADEISERSLLLASSVLSEIQDAAQLCYEEKTADPMFACLGAKEDLNVTVFDGSA
jgi:hypothetical protein